MKTWNDYKDHVKTVGPVTARDMEEIESISSTTSAMIKQHQIPKHYLIFSSILDYS